MKTELFNQSTIESDSYLGDCYRIFITWILLFFFIVGQAQSNITRLEYYIDTDPGFGKANTVSITASTTIADKLIGINPKSKYISF